MIDHLVYLCIRLYVSHVPGVEVVDVELEDEGEGVSLVEDSRRGVKVVRRLAAAIKDGGRLAVDMWQ